MRVESVSLLLRIFLGALFCGRSSGLELLVLSGGSGGRSCRDGRDQGADGTCPTESTAPLSPALKRDNTHRHRADSGARPSVCHITSAQSRTLSGTNSWSYDRHQRTRRKMRGEIFVSWHESLWRNFKVSAHCVNDDQFLKMTSKPWGDLTDVGNDQKSADGDAIKGME